MATTKGRIAAGKTVQPSIQWLLLVLGVGVLSGVAGLFSALLLKSAQHLAYGYSPLHLVSNETFLQGVSASSPLRRVMILCLCGLIAGFGWWALSAYGQRLVSIAEALKSKKPMPVFSTLVHAMLQLVTIGLGSPLGRETAPREISAVFAEQVSVKAGLKAEELRILVACGAGAGFAAVYNVPLSGALFTLEVLLCTWNWSVLLPALTTSVIATAVSWIGLGNEPQYHIAAYVFHPHLILWALLTGPLFGLAAHGFIRLTAIARKQAPEDRSLWLTCFINFLLIGLLAIYFPALLGNGKSPARLEFTNEIGMGLSLLLLGLRVIIVASSLRAGAKGGLLTPCLANGALLGVVLGGVFNFMGLQNSLNAYAIVGAAAFLAAGQNMPITAIVLLFELTQARFDLLMPMLTAVAGAVTIVQLIAPRSEK
ncbi:chloride channel protein [Legionella sp. MW5194]|uniref:chloride channel protein n=1 Tax=Legionella sp. MW5194 TaxID=2662448 RepID=UPI00193EAA8E|nr:chloride channel protein [Legionella sp. MW5194]QRN04017.1 chloride channel protein [Legionella sp. MW5194]